MSRRSLVLALILSAASLALLWTDQLPLGVPGEWTWGRLSYSAYALIWGGLLVLIGGGLYLGFAWAGEKRLSQASRWEAAAWVAALVAGNFAWLSVVQSAAIEGVGLGKSPYVLYYRRTEGYFWQARYEMASAPEFLREYEALMAEGDYLHIGTHPPGLALVHRGLLNLCRSAPWIVEATEATQPESVRQALDLISRQMRASGQEFTREDSAALWLAAWLTQLAAALTVIPLYRWLRVTEPRRVAWRAAAFWPLIPAVAIFLPKSDVLYPVLTMTAAALWRQGWLACHPRWRFSGVIWCSLSALVLAAGLTLSLAFLPVIALIAVQSVCDGLPTSPDSGRATASGERSRWHRWMLIVLYTGCWLWFFGGFVLALHRAGLNLINVWSWNFSNHALFYDHNLRTYWKWLLVNPLELTLAVGAPVIVMLKSGVWGMISAGDWSGLRRSAAPAFVAVWTLLWLSGKNMGEAARLWIILMPWLIAATATAWHAARSGSLSHDGSGEHRDRLYWLALLAIQIAVSSLTVLRIDGFHFTELTAGG